MYLQLAMAINLSSFGTTFVDLKYLLNTTIDKISLVIIAQSGGFLIGCCFGFVYNYINRQMTMAITLLLLAITVVLVPYCWLLWQLYLCSFIQGLGYGVYYNSNNVWLLEMFQEKSGPVFQLSGFIYGLGTILGPVIYQPYVTGEKRVDEVIDITYIYETNRSNESTIDVTLNASHYLSIDVDIEVTLRRYKLKVPFLICGVIVLIGSALLTTSYICKRYRINCIEIEKDNDVDRKLSFDTVTGKLTLISCMLLFSFHCASDDTYVQFAATYLQYIPLELTAKKSAEIVSYMGLVFTLSQGLSVFIALRLQPHHMLGYHFIIMLIGILVMYFGKESLLLMWSGILVMAFGIGAVFPLIFSFMSSHIEVCDKVGTALNFASKIPGLFVPTIIGLYIDTHSDVYIYVMLFDLCVCTLLVVLVLVLVNRHRGA